jgi:hypothetical protein
VKRFRWNGSNSNCHSIFHDNLVDFRVTLNRASEDIILADVGYELEDASWSEQLELSGCMHGQSRCDDQSNNHY